MSRRGDTARGTRAAWASPLEAAARRWVLLLAWLVAGACALPHEMELAAPGADHCPAPSTRQASTPPDSSTLRWYRPTEARDHELGRRWCATVGPSVVRLQPEEAVRASWRAGSDLELVTWNAQIGGGDIFRFLREELGVDCAPTGPSLSAGAGPFVLMLQEIWRYSEDLPVVEGGRIIPFTIDPEREDGEDPDIVEVADRCGLALVYVPSARNGPDSGSRPSEDKGNALLANVPLSTPIAFDLPLEGGRKVAVAATVVAPGQERVRVVSVHLDVASTLVRALLSANQTRLRQAAGLVDGLDRAERDGPVHTVTIVGGDFNTWAGNEATLQFMRREFPQSSEWDRRGSRGGYPTDHIFVRGDPFDAFAISGYERIDDSYGSDHQARRMTLRYAPPR